MADENKMQEMIDRLDKERRESEERMKEFMKASEERVSQMENHIKELTAPKKKKANGGGFKKRIHRFIRQTETNGKRFVMGVEKAIIGIGAGIERTEEKIHKTYVLVKAAGILLFISLIIITLMTIGIFVVLLVK